MLSSLLLRSARATIVTLTVATVALGAPVSPAVAAPHAAAMLRLGTGLGAKPSVQVRRLQRVLARRGLDLGPSGVDGRFGPFTARAVRGLQARYGLAPDGIVGPMTRRLVGLLATADAARRTRAPRTHAPSPPPATQSPQPQPRITPQQQPQTTPPPQTTTTRGQRPSRPQPARVVTVSAASSSSGPSLAIILAALAALLAAAALAVALRRRRGAPDGAPKLAAIDRDVFLEGRSERPDVGTFRGFALATAVPSDAIDDPRRTRYLVDDPRKPAPVWVEGWEIDRSPSQLPAGEPVIGYVTTDADPAREHDAFVAIEEFCEEAGWALRDVVREADTGRMVGRPGLTTALERIAGGEARGLVVNDTRTVARSLRDLGALLEWFRDAHAALIAVDLGLDTATTAGHQTASALMAVAGWEGDRSANRARRGLVRVQPPDRGAVRTGDERTALAHRIHAMYDAGMSPQAIAAQLGREGVPPLDAGGERWSAAAVRAVLEHPPRRGDIRDELPAIPSRHRRR
jgi:DNA invertase Pin-like site-specific DNA recombinase/peptidoglycan hydrolase-like protein with peptidoglycan-binding domain